VRRGLRQGVYVTRRRTYHCDLCGDGLGSEVSRFRVVIQESDGKRTTSGRVLDLCPEHVAAFRKFLDDAIALVEPIV